MTPPEVSEGVGAKVKRVVGSRGISGDCDPFLMLDHFKGKLPGIQVFFFFKFKIIRNIILIIYHLGGFPDHPHRGFETVTYMLKGIMNVS